MMVQRKGLAEHDQRMVGKRLIALREARDWKQITFAKKLGVSAQRLNNWGTGPQVRRRRCRNSPICPVAARNESLQVQ